jgi:hypothetical protein
MAAVPALFEDIFDVKERDPDGKYFDRGTGLLLASLAWNEPPVRGERRSSGSCTCQGLSISRCSGHHSELARVERATCGLLLQLDGFAHGVACVWLSHHPGCSNLAAMLWFDTLLEL